MAPDLILLTALLMGIGALLYTSVGHAGASAYLAIMALVGFAPETMKPTALVLNILVASFTSWRFVRAGQFDLRTALPFIAGAVPFAFLGGAVQLPAELYRPIVGVVLWLAGIRLLWPRPLERQRMITAPPVLAGLLGGAGIGLLSGLTGTGGGIFLSPVLLFCGWAAPRRASGIAAVFILCNSIAGLAGNLSSVGRLPAELPWFVAAVASGALIGTHLGVVRLPSTRLFQVLGLVLLIAGAKLVLT